MSKIKIKNSLNELKSFCHKYSREYFANSWKLMQILLAYLKFFHPSF
jgi:hypothetical protein